MKPKSINKKNTPLVYRFTIKKSVKIIDTKEGYFVLKKKKENREGTEEITKLYDYLRSRSFSYFPNLLKDDEEYYIYEYIDDIDTPREQRALDLIRLTALLHSKTTYFKEVDMDRYKEIYERLLGTIDDLFNYYNGLMNIIDQSVYMSPREYLLATNSSKIFASLSFCRKTLDEWYDIIKESHKQRVVTIHNNLEVDHLLENEKPYLIGFEHAKRDMPIYDLYHFYKKHSLEFDFQELFQVYEQNYPLTKEEKKLLQVLLVLPPKIEFTNHMYEDCKNMNQALNDLYKTEFLVKPNTVKN